MRWFLALLLTTLPGLAAPQQSHHEQVDKPQILAPGYSVLEFPTPAAGSYTLPVLGSAADGNLLDESGSPITLHTLYDDRIVVLSFIYTACPDVNGCPLATFVLSMVQRRLATEPSTGNV